LRVGAEIAFLRAATDGGFILSARTIGSGGLLAALCAMAFPALDRDPIGVRLTHPRTWTNGVVGDLESYFGEAGGFIIETAEPDGLAAVAGEHVDLIPIGETEAGMQMKLEGAQFDLRVLRELWRAPLAEVYP
jgi:phosphoribosylformylglycinamidine (FGAM) synthase-like enzyme